MDDTMFQLIGQLIRLKAKGFCCSQIMVILALDAQGKTNDDLVRSMGGLCFGSHAGEICGALSGGTCLISLYAGRGADEETSDDRYMIMTFELAHWFKGMADTEYGGMKCDDILGKSPNQAMCGRIVSDTYKKCMDILKSNGFNPAVSKNG